MPANRLSVTIERLAFHPNDVVVLAGGAARDAAGVGSLEFVKRLFRIEGVWRPVHVSRFAVLPRVSQVVSLPTRQYARGARSRPTLGENGGSARVAGGLAARSARVR